MFAVYCLLLEMNRIYVGETPFWRLETRWKEHANPNRGASKWTSKYPVKEFVHTATVGNKRRTLLAEHRLTEKLMEIYGLDVVRGGNYVMRKEGGNWWVRPHLKHIPRFTSLWSSLSECTFAAFVKSDLALSGAPRLPRFFSGSPLPSERGPVERQLSTQECS